MANLLNFLKPKLYVKINGHYRRIVGPQELLDSIKAIGGYVVIGHEIEIFIFAGSIDVGSDSINDFHISQMKLAPLNKKDRRELKK